MRGSEMDCLKPIVDAVMTANLAIIAAIFSPVARITRIIELHMILNDRTRVLTSIQIKKDELQVTYVPKQSHLPKLTIHDDRTSDHLILERRSICTAFRNAGASSFNQRLTTALCM
jgi:hypothetical protein